MRLTMRPSELLGRRKILTDEKEITESNVVDVLRKSYEKHRLNVYDMQFLIDYELGIQPLMRPKLIRPEIDIHVSSGVANYIKEFKLDYNWSSPALLVRRGNKDLLLEGHEANDDAISALNSVLQNKEHIGAKDLIMAEFIEVTGIGHTMVDISVDKDHLFNDYALDSRYAFCVYHNGPGHKKLMGVTFVKRGGKIFFTCFTDKLRYEISGWEITKVVVNPLMMIPIVEYERSVDRTGSFERKISEIDALNIMMSDYTNDVSQRTQEIWWGNDIEFPKDPTTGETIKPTSGQWVLTFSGGDKNPKIQPMSSTFTGSSTLDAITASRTRILQDCKVPIQYESSGGGSTGTATDMSSGWSAAELDAMREQQMTERGKREELELILRAIKLLPSSVLPETSELRNIEPTDVDFHFPRRRNYDMATKANFMATLLAKGFNGRHVIKTADAFENAEQVWADSKDMIEKIQESIASNGESSTTDDLGLENTSLQDNSDQLGNSPIADKI